MVGNNSILFCFILFEEAKKKSLYKLIVALTFISMRIAFYWFQCWNERYGIYLGLWSNKTFALEQVELVLKWRKFFGAWMRAYFIHIHHSQGKIQLSHSVNVWFFFGLENKIEQNYTLFISRKNQNSSHSLFIQINVLVFYFLYIIIYSFVFIWTKINTFPMFRYNTINTYSILHGNFSSHSNHLIDIYYNYG